jgi:hypothetical protein
MGATRKLQGEIDRVLKKVQEGVDVFDSIWNKVRRPPPPPSYSFYLQILLLHCNGTEPQCVAAFLWNIPRVGVVARLVEDAVLIPFVCKNPLQQQPLSNRTALHSLILWKFLKRSSSPQTRNYEQIIGFLIHKLRFSVGEPLGPFNLQFVKRFWSFLIWWWSEFVMEFWLLLLI